MSFRFCPRCENQLPSEADGSLLFCPACGAPQVRVSEQLLEEAAQRRHAEQEEVAHETAAVRDTSGRDLVRTAALVGGVAALLATISNVLPPVNLLLWFWAVGAPVVALGLHLARYRDTHPDIGVGARLGFLSGVAVALALMAVNTVFMLLARFALHRSAQLDAALTGIFLQMRVAAEAQHGAADAAPLLNLLSIPEFRAGLLLTSMALFLCGYLLLTTAGGAFAGFLRQRKAQS